MGAKGHNSSSESDEWEDESWTVDCPCGVNFDDGEEMVECDECGVWVHTSCCRVSKDLPTYNCDKCKAKKKRKETEESEVAQLLAEFPGKTVSFDDKRQEKSDLFAGHVRTSTELPIQKHVHVHGIPGGDPSFFEGLSKVFCRQLWKCKGYVPKHLKMDYNEFPQVQVDFDIAELLKNEVPLDTLRNGSTVKLENGNLYETVADELLESELVLRTEGNNNEKDDVFVEQNILEKVQYVRKADGKHGKHRHKPKVKEGKLHQGKRTREEGLYKDFAGKKKPRNNVETCTVVVHAISKFDASPLAEDTTPSKSPQSSPKNPKAMKKLAVQEFMDMRVCSRCGRVETLLARAIVHNGGSAGGVESFLCKDCEHVGSSGGFSRADFVNVMPENLEFGKVDTSRILNTFTNSVGMRVDHEVAKGHLLQHISVTKQAREVSQPTPDDEAKNLVKEGEWNGVVTPMEVDSSLLPKQDAKGSGKVDQLIDTHEKATPRVVSRAFEKRSKLTAKTGDIHEALESTTPKGGSLPFFRQSVVAEGASHEPSDLPSCIVTCGNDLGQQIDKSVCPVPCNQAGAVGFRHDVVCEEKQSKCLSATGMADDKGHGSARTSGHLPASVREKLLADRGQLSQRSLHLQADVALFSCPLVTTEDVAAFNQQESYSQSPSASKLVHPSRSHAIQMGGIVRPHLGTLDMSPSSVQQSEQFQLQRQLEPLAVEQNRDTLTSSQHIPMPSSPQTTVCQQARQPNGHGHVLGRIKAATLSGAGSSSSIQTLGNLGVIRLSSSASSTARVIGTSSKLLSPSTSSCPSSPVLSTPTSKSHQLTVKVPGSPPPPSKLAVSGIALKPSHSQVRYSSPGSPKTSSSKPGTLSSSKSFPAVTASSASAKSSAGVSKFGSRSPSLPTSKSVEGNSTLPKASNVVSPRGGFPSVSPASSAMKDNHKLLANANSKSAPSGKSPSHNTVAKPPSAAKSFPSPPKPASVAHVGKQYTGPAKSSAPTSSNKHASTLQSSKLGCSKEEKSPSPASKALSAMPPPAQTSSKRSPPSILTNTEATILNDEEFALLLHQQLNSSPRVPRVPRVRQLVSSAQPPSSKISKRPGGSTLTTSTADQKDLHLGSRKKVKEDRQKERPRKLPHVVEESSKGGTRKHEDNKIEEVTGGADKVGSSGMAEGNSLKEKRSVARDGNARHQTFAKSNLSIVVPPGADDAPAVADKKSLADHSILTLPGLVDEVLSSKGCQLSYEDVCEAVLPHWPKLRKPNGERYAYASHRQAVLDCLRNRSTWSHLVDRGPKTNLGRKKKQNESAPLSESGEDDETQHFGAHSNNEDGLLNKSTKKVRELEGEKLEGERAGDIAILEEVPKGKRKARRRRVAIEDGTDGDEEIGNDARRELQKQETLEVHEDEEPDATTSPSSEEVVSNYSEEDEEMVVHRGVRGRRCQTDGESSGSDDLN